MKITNTELVSAVTLSKLNAIFYEKKNIYTFILSQKEEGI